ncbi:hypothetical protein FRC12_016944, partial [Ceratobasidium sp. 428]
MQSEVYKDATEDSRADVFLLSHLAAEHFYKLMTLDDAQGSANASVLAFWDLLTSKNTPGRDTIPALNFTSPSVLAAAAARFGNNNFVIHDARLVPYAHGVFALASRSFNHSCKPNTASMFEPTQGGIQMVVKLLEDVGDGQEICISYTDPASPHSKRRDALEHVYGFSCQCPRCAHDISAASLSLGPENAVQLRHQIESSVEAQIRNEQSTLDTLRDELGPVLPFLDGVLLKCLPIWTTEFSTASHDGPYDKALSCGNAVLGVYLLVYPGIHPLLELHCLELCKVAWNHFITSVAPGQPDSMHVKGAALTYFRWAKKVAGLLHEGLEVSRASIVSEYDALESCLREE